MLSTMMIVMPIPCYKCSFRYTSYFSKGCQFSACGVVFCRECVCLTVYVKDLVFLRERHICIGWFIYVGFSIFFYSVFMFLYVKVGPGFPPRLSLRGSSGVKFVFVLLLIDLYVLGLDYLFISCRVYVLHHGLVYITYIYWRAGSNINITVILPLYQCRSDMSVKATEQDVGWVDQSFACRRAR